jgi:hypothetical protein
VRPENVREKLKGPPFATVKLKLLNQIDLFGNQVSKKHDFIYFSLRIISNKLKKKINFRVCKSSAKL